MKSNSRPILRSDGFCYDREMKAFIDFIREQGVVGLAVGFMLGGAVSKVVASLVGDIINPVLGIALGAAGDLKSATVAIGGASVA